MGKYFPELIIIPAHTACVWEATSRKVGNVHPGASFNDSAYLDFILSAGAITWSLGRAPQHTIGRVIRDAARWTRAATRTNSNIGIILLLAPLASTISGLGLAPADRNLGQYRGEISQNLRKLSVEDTK